jgi:molecular chaperone DnaK (HSP70)
VPQIEVAFEIDVNGILKVAASDQGTGKEQSILISHTGGLKPNEIEKMRLEAEKYAESDRRRLQMIDIRHQSDSLFYSYEVTLRENSELVAPLSGNWPTRSGNSWKSLCGPLHILRKAKNHLGRISSDCPRNRYPHLHK